MSLRGSSLAACLLSTALAAGCGSTPPGGTSDGATADGAGDGGQPDGGPPRPIRFVALGDTGEGSPAQYTVAAAIENVCADAGGCDFAVLLGDNVYDGGVTSTDDPQWQTKFELPYANLDMPFYAVLGNHDYGGQLLVSVPGLGNEWDKGQWEVAYTGVSDKWQMPDTHYTRRFGDLGLIALDTNSILWSNTTYGDQRAWYPTALSEVAGSQWVIVIGHHPYLSNGQHGNAGDYDAPELAGIPIPNPLPIQNGDDLKTFFDQVVCGTADLYLCGHDHERQWLDEPTALCGTEMLVSGAGAKLTDFVDRGNAYHWQDDQDTGFLLIEVDGKQLTGQFYGSDGVLDFERVLTKP